MSQLKDYLKLLAEFPWLVENESAPIKIVTDADEIQAWSKKNATALGILLQDKYITVLRDLVVFPNDAIGGYNRIINSAAFNKGAKGVAILPVFQSKILLMNIFRHPIRQWSIEIPRGFGENHLPPRDIAALEIKEEIGGEIAVMTDLGIVHSNSGLEGNEIHLFHAELESYGHPQTSEGISDFELIHISKFEAMIAETKITDGFTISAYTRAKLKGFL